MTAGSVQQAPLMDPASRAGRIGDDYHMPDAGLAEVFKLAVLSRAGKRDVVIHLGYFMK